MTGRFTATNTKSLASEHGLRVLRDLRGDFRARPRRGLLACAAVLVSASIAAQAPDQASRSRIYLTAAGAGLIAQGLALPAPTGAEAATFEDVPPPSLRNVPNDGYAQVTVAPWVESNGWRFQRGARRAKYARLPRGAAPLAAAEAFAFGADAILDPDPADLQDLADLLRFLNGQPQPRWPVLANIGVIDDGSPEVGEALNMLTRRNLLYRLVSRPDPQLDLTIQPGTGDFPRAAFGNPSELAARVRETVGDDNRLIRLFGTTTVIARLTGDGTRARLVLLSYSRTRQQQDVRVRVLGRYRPASFAPFGAPPGTQPADVEEVGGATELTIPRFSTLAIVDFEVVR